MLCYKNTKMVSFRHRYSVRFLSPLKCQSQVSAINCTTADQDSDWQFERETNKLRLPDSKIP